MAEFSKLMMTGKGQALIAKVIAGTGNVEFTKIVTSSTYEPEQTEGLTELANVEQTSLISSIMRTNEVAVKIETSFNNLGLTAGYYMRSLGLYAIDPDEGEILYAVTTEVSGNCYMPAYNGVTVSGAYVKLIATVGNAEHISLEVNAAATATIGNIRELRENLGSVEIRFDDVEDAERENIQSRETLGTMLGKIRKWFSDLKSGAFAGVVNDCVTTEEGTVLDGRQGKVLKDEIDGLKAADSEINSNINNLKKSVSDGKSSVASAITAKGVTTAADAAYATMAANIRAISTNPRIYHLGTGYSFNVAGICSNYKNLNINNFIVNVSVPQVDTYYDEQGRATNHFARLAGFTIQKNYNTSNGQFSISNYTGKVQLRETNGNMRQEKAFNVTCDVYVVY